MNLLERYPSHALAAALCAGLSLALLLRAGGLLVGGAAAVAAFLAASGGPSRHLAAALAFALLGLLWGSLRLDALDRSVLDPRVGEVAPATVVVTGPARRGEFSVRVPATVERFDRVAIRERVLLELPAGRAPPQGARLELVASIREPRPPDRGFDERAWLERQGVHVVVRGAGWRVIGRRGGIAGLADRLHARLAAAIAPGLHGERRAVVAGIVLGEDEGLSDGLRDAFRASGLYHLLAVSGANVAVIVWAALGLATAVGLSRWVGEGLALGGIAAYLAAVGWQPSVVRAGVAGVLASLAWLAARPRDRWHFLLLGAVVLLAWNPRSLLEPGFQLSFAAVAAIFVAVPWLERELEGYPVHPTLAAVLAVSIACGAATAPILWLHFGSVPVWSVPANAVAWPVAAPILALGLAAAVVEPIVPPAATALAWLNGWLAAYLAAAARATAALPFAQVGSATAITLLGGLVAVGVAVRRTRGRARRAVLVGAAVAVALVGLWRLVPAGGAVPPPAGLRITALDVGQGDAILVEAPGAALLVDQGPPEGRAAGQLRRRGLRGLSMLVLTHPQRDHVGGARDVVRRLDVALVLDPALRARSPYRDDAVAEARRRGVRVAVARAGQVYRLGPLLVRVLWPPDAGAPNEDPNQNAVVLVVSYESIDVLLTADAETDVTLPLRPPPVEILKVAHHGSADAGLPELLRQTRPRIALVSVGRGNDYGHPAPSTLAALAEAPGLVTYRTDVDGAVTVESAAGGLLVREER
ncbi:MAG TPA: ComEC/Rec2 family competence protein [Gaiellaceae bacterium]|nr:ComEC/Rec2 family competence protein [Gaiellaceae bacterium]